MSKSIYLRDILQRSPNGISLIVEAKITQEEFDAMRTTTLITPETVFELPSIVYWYDGGNGLHLRCRKCITLFEWRVHETLLSCHQR